MTCALNSRAAYRCSSPNEKRRRKAPFQLPQPQDAQWSSSTITSRGWAAGLVALGASAPTATTVFTSPAAKLTDTPPACSNGVDARPWRQWMCPGALAIALSQACPSRSGLQTGVRRSADFVTDFEPRHHQRRAPTDFSGSIDERCVALPSHACVKPISKVLTPPSGLQVTQLGSGCATAAGQSPSYRPRLPPPLRAPFTGFCASAISCPLCPSSFGVMLSSTHF